MGCGSSKAAPDDAPAPAGGVEAKDEKKGVDLSGQELKDLSSLKLPLAPDVKILDASDNALATIPAEIGGCTGLEELLLFKNKLKELPKELGSLSTLTTINVFNNQIKKIPPEFAELTALEEVNFAANKLMQVPDAIMTKWSSVKILSLYDNNIVKLGSLAPLTALEELRLYNTPLDSLPDLGSAPLANLTILEMHHSAGGGQIKEIPDDYFSKAPNLSRLLLSGHKGLTKLPASLLSCKGLKNLQAYGCGLTELPSGEWPALETLFLQENEALTELPAELGTVTAFSRVNLSKTALSADGKKTADKIKATCLKNPTGMFWGVDGRKLPP